MLNLRPKIYTKPFPHIVIKDFIQDTTMLEFLRNNQELPAVMETLGDLERVEIGRIRKGPYSYDLRKANTSGFSSSFRSNTLRVIDRIEGCSRLRKLVEKTFTPHFNEWYEPFDEDFKQMMTTYGAYNKTSKPLNLIGWHLDNGKKLCSGFIYLREDGDTADDGNLWLSNGKEKKKIPYEDNVFVIWPNLPNAWHKADVRNPTDHLRRIVNVVYETQHDRRYHDYRTYRNDKIVDENQLYPYKLFGYKKVRVKEYYERKKSEDATPTGQGSQEG